MIAKRPVEKRINTHFEPFPHTYNVYAMTTEDGREENIFRWNVPKGTLRPRMSAFELCQFIFGYMSFVVANRMLRLHPRIEAEFNALYMRLASTPRVDLDQLLPWIRVEWGVEKIKYPTGVMNLQPSPTCDIIHMNFFDQRPQAAGPTYSIAGTSQPNMQRNAERAREKERENLIAKLEELRQQKPMKSSVYQPKKIILA